MTEKHLKAHNVRDLDSLFPTRLLDYLLVG